MLILLVDDEPNVSDYIQTVLTERCEGLFSFFRAYDYDSAVSLLHGHAIDCVISDIQMPGKNGLMLMEHVICEYPKIPFILLSAYPNFEYVYEANKHNVKYLLKMESDDVIVQTVLDAVANVPKESESPQAGKATAPIEQSDIIGNLKAYIRQNYAEDLSLDRLSGICYMNASYLSRLFKQTTGQNIIDFVNDTRIGEAKRLLTVGGKKANDVAALLGYGSATYFGYVFKRLTGVTPQTYKKNFASKALKK